MIDNECLLVDDCLSSSSPRWPLTSTHHMTAPYLVRALLPKTRTLERLCVWRWNLSCTLMYVHRVGRSGCPSLHPYLSPSRLPHSLCYFVLSVIIPSRWHTGVISSLPSWNPPLSPWIVSPFASLRIIVSGDKQRFYVTWLQVWIILVTGKIADPRF